MAKKKAAPKKAAPKTTAPLLGIVDTAELLADGDNPREISDEAAGGLRNSLKRFGDISGIVFNRRTGELVCGHQRMTQFRAEFGDQPIEPIDAETGRIYTPDRQHFLNVRVVDWSPALQRAANVAANNQKIAGKFTDDLSTYLLEVQAELQDEAPGALDDCLLIDLLDIELEDDEEPKNVDITERYQVVVELENEEQQKEVHELLTKKGWKCRVLTV